MPQIFSFPFSLNWRLFTFSYKSRSMSKTKVVMYSAIMFLLFFILLCLYTRTGSSDIECSCHKKVRTKERVQRYLWTLMNQRNVETQRTTLEEAEIEHSSLAVRFLVDVERQGKRCIATPGLFDIRHRNDVWQEAEIGGSIFLLFSAFIDFRDTSEGPLIRILAMSDNAWPSDPWCHLYDANTPANPPSVSKAIRLDFIHWEYPKRDSWHPFLITCRANVSTSKLPEVVSLVSAPCSPPTNALKIVYSDSTQNKKKDIALCHKFLFHSTSYNFLSIIEWIELARAWGVDHITFYASTADNILEKVLNYYQSSGFVTVIPWKNPGSQPNVPSLLRALYDTQRYVLFTNENIPYTDCLLRHIGSHRYVGVWDLDEFFFPVGAKSFSEMMDRVGLELSKETALSGTRNIRIPTSYLARSSYFFNDKIDVKISKHITDFINKTITGQKNMEKSTIRKMFPILSHTIRTEKLTPPAVFTKSIHDTSKALALHAHFALYNLDGPVDREKDLYHLSPKNEGFLGHFRSKCQGEEQTECDKTFRPDLTSDLTMWTHASQVIINTINVINSLEL